MSDEDARILNVEAYRRFGKYLLFKGTVAKYATRLIGVIGATLLLTVCLACIFVYRLNHTTNTTKIKLSRTCFIDITFE